MTLWHGPYDYELPPERVAHVPAEPRDAARLLVWPEAGEPGAGVWTFKDLPNFLNAGDVLVVNRSAVIPARLHGVRPARAVGGTDVTLEVLLHRALDMPHQRADGHWGQVWQILAKPARRLKVGDVVQLAGQGTAEVLATEPQLQVRLVAPRGQTLAAYLDAHGHTPLPPYIHTTDCPEIRARYQTVYADQTRSGSVAAPTAGLHFTPAVLAALQAKGVQVHEVVLHVGAGTFMNPTPEQLASGKLHAEWAHLPLATAHAVQAAQERGSQVVAVGTTAMRTLETWGLAGLPEEGWTGDTQLFIQPGFAFKVVNRLITNFHLPGSSLMMLVAAFVGLEEMQSLYDKAIAENYRFYSFGDSSLLSCKDLQNS